MRRRGPNLFGEWRKWGKSSEAPGLDTIKKEKKRNN